MKELQKYIDVAIFGRCGEKYAKAKQKHVLERCSLHCAMNSIYRMSGSVEKGTDSFKFYLAFENALCKDYVTEKFFSRVGHILPVVKGK